MGMFDWYKPTADVELPERPPPPKSRSQKARNLGPLSFRVFRFADWRT